MKRVAALVCAFIMLVVACAAPAILVPQDPGPCGMNAFMCSDGMCCPNDTECTVDRIYMPDPPQHGHCTWVGWQ